MNARPTLAELRTRAHKQRHREIGNWLARRVARPSAIYGTWVAVRLGLSANQVTLLALIANLAAAGLVGCGSTITLAAGVGLLVLGFWLDHVDGQVARWRDTSSLSGVYFDYCLHHVSTLALGFALGMGLAVRTGHVAWSAAGCAIALGWAMLGIHNDARYKAFFQRLKSSRTRYFVDGGSGGRPVPPAPWPRRGLGMFTWPAYKLCELHVVLVSLAIIAVCGLFSSELATRLWRGYVLVMAGLAPLLAAARVGRSVARGACDREFDDWFRPGAPA